MADTARQSQYMHISGTAAGTTVVLDRNGTFEKVIFNQNKTGTATFYDVATADGSAAGNLILVANNNVGSLPMTLDVGCRVKNGLVGVVGGTTDFTVIYN